MVIVQQGPVLAMLPSCDTHTHTHTQSEYVEESDTEARRTREREKEREQKDQRDVREGKNNNNRLWKGDKLRNKECIHEAARKRRDKVATACRWRRGSK